MQVQNVLTPLYDGYLFFLSWQFGLYQTNTYHTVCTGFYSSKKYPLLQHSRPSRDSDNDKTKNFFWFFRVLFEIISFCRFWEIDKMALFNPYMKFNCFCTKCFQMKCYENVITWFYPKYVSGVFIVLMCIKVDTWSEMISKSPLWN